MAEITYTGNGNLFVSAVLNKLLWMMLTENIDLRRTCVDMGPPQGGSASEKISQWKDDDAMAAANADEVTPVGNTGLTTGTATITIARQALARDVSDLFTIIGVNGPQPNIPMIAERMYQAGIRRFNGMLASLFPGLSQIVTTDGANNVDQVLQAQYKLEQQGVDGPYHCVLARKQLTDFKNSLRGESGVFQFQEATAQMLAVKGPGYQGNWNGIEFYTSNRVTSANGKYIGALYGHGAFAYKEAPPPNLAAVPGVSDFIQSIPQGSPIWVEFHRDAKAGITSAVGNYYVGVSENEDLRGCQILSAT